jgi:hypothetical protein
MGWLGLNDYLVIEAAARARLDDLTRLDDAEAARTVRHDAQSHDRAEDD